MKYLPPFITHIFTFCCIILCTQSCASFTSKKVSGSRSNQSAIAAARAFGSLDGDASDSKQFENIQTNTAQDLDLFHQYENNVGGSRYRWYNYHDGYFGENVIPYNSLKRKILLKAQEEALGEIKTEISAVLYDKQMAVDGYYTSSTESQIKARVTGVLRSEYWQSEFRPPLHKIKPGDSLEFIGRFDQVAYRERLESDKRKNEELAKNSFDRAHESYAKGILYKCLEDMAVCHYYIYNGGNNIQVFDPIQGRKAPIIDALFSLAEEIKKGVVVNVLDEGGYTIDDDKVKFIKSASSKNLSLEIDWFGEPYQDVGGVRIKLIDTFDKQEEFINVGETRRFNFEISDFLKGNKSISDWHINFDISANLGPDADGVSDWMSSDSYQKFLTELLHKKIQIEDITLSQQKIIFIHEQCKLGCGDMSEYHKLAENRIKQLGLEYFFDMRGVGDISNSVKKEIELEYKNEKKISDSYNLDGIFVIRFDRKNYADEMFLEYYTINNLEQPKMEWIEKAGMLTSMSEKIVEEGVKNFFDNYLFRVVKFEHGNKKTLVQVERVINNQPVEGSIQMFGHKEIARFPDQGRYSDLTFRFSADGYRTEEISIEAAFLSYFNVFPREHKNEGTNTKKINLKKTRGIAEIMIASDNNKIFLNKNNLSNTEIKIGKKVNLFQKKWDDPIIGKLNHRYENSTGGYFIKVSAPGFQKHPEIPFDIIDGEVKKVDINLKYKSKLKAFAWSSLLPGTGHMYMQKGNLSNNLLTLGFYSLSLGAAFKYHDSYQRYRSDFLAHQEEFIVSTDRLTSDESRKMAQKSWNQMKDAKNYFIGMTASAVLTNLVTSIMLMFTS